MNKAYTELLRHNLEETESILSYNWKKKFFSITVILLNDFNKAKGTKVEYSKYISKHWDIETREEITNEASDEAYLHEDYFLKSKCYINKYHKERNILHDSFAVYGLRRPSQINVFDDFLSTIFVEFINKQCHAYRGIPEVSVTNKRNIDKLNSFLEYEDNWDEEGAHKISLHAVQRGIELIQYIDKIGLDVFFSNPTANGGIGIELREKDKSKKLIIEIFADGAAVYHKVENNKVIFREALVKGFYYSVFNWLSK